MFHTDIRRSNDGHLYEWAKDVVSQSKDVVDAAKGKKRKGRKTKK